LSDKKLYKHPALWNYYFTGTQRPHNRDNIVNRIIRQGTKLNYEEQKQYDALLAEFNEIGKRTLGKGRARSIFNSFIPDFLNAGHGSTLEGFLNAKREIIADLRARVGTS
jgi:hypothetical protein